MLGTKVILVALSAAFAAADDWDVGFYNHNCVDSVSPGKTTGGGAQDCAPVAAADCMNGHVNPSGISKNGWLICGYTGSNCDGSSTSLDSSAGSAHAVIYENGGVQAINSYKVITSGSC